MISTFLPLAINNTHWILLHYIWVFIWSVSLILFYPKIFFNKLLMYILIFGLIIFLCTKTIWNNMDVWNSRMLIGEIYPIATGVSVFSYYIQTKDFIGLAKLTRWILLFILITAIMTIYASSIDPLYARNLIGMSTLASKIELETAFQIIRFGGGGYSTAAAFMCLFPILIYYLKDIKETFHLKFLIMLYSLIIFFALLRMQIFGNIVLAIIFSVVAIIGIEKKQKSVLLIFVLFSILYIIPKGKYVSNLVSVSEKFAVDSDIHRKIQDLSIFIETGASLNDNTTEIGGRTERYPLLYNSFIKAPILGCYFFLNKNTNGYQAEGGHLYWMNKLTVTGIIGLLFFLWIPFSFFKKSLPLFNSKFKYYYILGSLSILSYGFLKNIAGQETWYALFILLPGMYYLPLLKSKS